MRTSKTWVYYLFIEVILACYVLSDRNNILFSNKNKPRLREEPAEVDGLSTFNVTNLTTFYQKMQLIKIKRLIKRNPKNLTRQKSSFLLSKENYFTYAQRNDKKYGKRVLMFAVGKKLKLSDTFYLWIPLNTKKNIKRGNRIQVYLLDPKTKKRHKVLVDMNRSYPGWAWAELNTSTLLPYVSENDDKLLVALKCFKCRKRIKFILPLSKKRRRKNKWPVIRIIDNGKWKKQRVPGPFLTIQM